MAVDNYSDLQKFEHPITFDMVEEDLIAAEEFLSKQLWYSTNYLIDYQLNDPNRGCLLSDGSISELLKKSESYARNKKFVSEVYVNPFETPNAAISTWYCNNMAFALYNALILLYETPFISFEEFGTLILNYKENVENDVCDNTQNSVQKIENNILEGIEQEDIEFYETMIEDVLPSNSELAQKAHDELVKLIDYSCEKDYDMALEKWLKTIDESVLISNNKTENYNNMKKLFIEYMLNQEKNVA